VRFQSVVERCQPTLRAHTEVQVTKAAACRLIDEVWRVVRQWRVYFENFRIPEAETAKIAPAFRHVDDISTLQLRKLLD
jgi:serine/threonine-protein kinase HipA